MSDRRHGGRGRRTAALMAALAAALAGLAVGAAPALADCHADPPAGGVPTASFSYGPPDPELGEVVSFDASGSQPSAYTYCEAVPIYVPVGESGEYALVGYDSVPRTAVAAITSYSWDFGDGSNATGPAPWHRFTAAGTYTVTLTATSSIGAAGITTRQVTIPTPPPLGAAPRRPREPSNAFSITAVAASPSKGTAALTVDLPGPGTIALLATARVRTAGRTAALRTIKVAALAREVAAGGAVRLAIRPSRAARRVLTRTRRLRIVVKLTYTPRGGTPSTRTRSVTLRLARRR